jgi:branched-chain amino acid transport system substrate-binding protein
VRRATALLAAAALLGGCASEGIERGGVVVGTTLTVQSLLPGPGRGAARDVVDGEKLALAEAGGEVAGFSVNFVSRDEGAQGGPEGDARAAAAARDAVQDTQAIAVIAGLHSEGAKVTAPLFNEAGLLQVAPGAGYPGLTAKRAPGEPERYRPAARATFARLVGDDRAQAAALVEAVLDPPPRGRARTVTIGPGVTGARARGRARVLAVEQEADASAASLAGEVRAAARAGGLRLTDDPARADAVVYAGSDVAGAAGVAAALAREAPGATVALPDALVQAGVEGRLGPAARRRAVLVSSAPALGATPALRDFERRFRASFRRAPGPGAVIGYEAMRAVLGAIRTAGRRGNRRQAVIDAFFAAPRRDTLLGDLRVARSGERVRPRFTLRTPG